MFASCWIYLLLYFSIKLVKYKIIWLEKKYESDLKYDETEREYVVISDDHLGHFWIAGLKKVGIEKM